VLLDAEQSGPGSCFKLTTVCLKLQRSCHCAYADCLYCACAENLILQFSSPIWNFWTCIWNIYMKNNYYTVWKGWVHCQCTCCYFCLGNWWKWIFVPKHTLWEACRDQWGSFTKYHLPSRLPFREWGSVNMNYKHLKLLQLIFSLYSKYWC